MKSLGGIWKRKKLIGLILLGAIFPLWKTWKFSTAERTYYPEGQIKCYSEVDFFDRDFEGHAAPSGITEFYYPDGKRKSVAKFKEGKKNGRCISWAPDGAVMDDWTFLMNRPADGKRQIRFEDGKIAEEFNYLNGGLDGRYTRWAHDGRRLDEWQFKSGKPVDGTRKVWSEDGALLYEESYQNGVQHGWSLSFGVDGKVTSKTLFDQGRRVQDVDFEPGGKIKQRIVIENDGSQTISNFTDGKLTRTFNTGKR